MSRHAVDEPFSPDRLVRELRIDGVLRGALLGVMFVGLLASGLPGRTAAVSTLVFLAALVGWGWLAARSVRVAGELPVISALVEADPAAAEARIAAALRRRCLQRWVRLLLYHRLALLRLRAGAFAEAATICSAVLRQPLGTAERARSHLLLIDAEARLGCGDQWGAWAALLAIGRCRLGLMELLQALVLHTRYHVEAGHDAAALEGLERKLPLVELLPAAESGAVHEMLATSARRGGAGELARWLADRGRLLAGDEPMPVVMSVGRLPAMPPEPDPEG